MVYKRRIQWQRYRHPHTWAVIALKLSHKTTPTLVGCSFHSPAFVSTSLFTVQALAQLVILVFALP